MIAAQQNPVDIFKIANNFKKFFLGVFGGVDW